MATRKAAMSGTMARTPAPSPALARTLLRKRSPRSVLPESAGRGAMSDAVAHASTPTRSRLTRGSYGSDALYGAEWTNDRPMAGRTFPGAGEGRLLLCPGTTCARSIPGRMMDKSQREKHDEAHHL